MSTVIQKAGMYNQPTMDMLQKMGFTSFGEVYYVNPTTGDDDYDGLSFDRPFATLAAAYDAATTNQDDFIVLSAYAAHAVTEMLDVSKNRIHFVSAAYRPGSVGLGARSRVTMGVTTAAADIAVMKNTGVGNTFSGIKFDSSNTKDESLYAVAEGGEYTIYEGCEFYKSSDLNVSLAAEVLNNGDSVQWVNCVFGSLANAIATACIRPNMLLSRETITGKVCRDNVIDHCLFLVNSDDTHCVRIYGGGATDVERMLYIKDSAFINSIAAAGTPAHAIGFGSAQTVGTVLLKDCVSVDHTVMKQASKTIYVAGPVPTHNTSGVAVTG